MTSKDKRTARVVGVLFLVAMVASLAGGVLIASVLDVPDYFTAVVEREAQVLAGVVLELVNATAVVGIAVLLFPVLKRFSEALALGYVALRVIEVAIAVAAVVSPLALIALSRTYATAAPADAAALPLLGVGFLTVRAYLVGQLLGIFFSLAALILYYLLYRTRLVPRFLSVWGLIAVAAVFSWNVLELLGMHVSAGMVFGLPIILNEIVLGIWLIVKGFNPSAAVDDAAAAELARA